MDTLSYIKVKKVNCINVDALIYDKLSSIFEPNEGNKFIIKEFGNFEVIFTFLPTYKITKLVLFLSKIGILIEHIDITSDALMSSMRNKRKHYEFVKTFEDESAKKELNEFLENNLSIDNILDKIIIKGVDSLTDIDKKILTKC